MIAHGLRGREDEPLNIKANAVAMALSEHNIFMTTDKDILVNMTPKEMIEESAANIISPLEEVEYLSFNSEQPEPMKVAVKLLSTLKKDEVMPVIDGKSQEMEYMNLQPLKQNKVKEEETKSVQWKPRRY